ncbi:hypothetical protein IFM89_013788 [Coptis chinensis]|uniref:Uncharacterized protein n=1 Tax=Coptis chinensis TaxID=261450 RepID=A0A835LVD7_9MAGN|nr:hypothetical protein IFM89_013788 [Coptis chinensis]
MQLSRSSQIDRLLAQSETLARETGLLGIGQPSGSEAMSHYGYEIVQTLIVDIEPDEHVKRAMNEINAGKRSDVEDYFSYKKFKRWNLIEFVLESA